MSNFCDFEMNATGNIEDLRLLISIMEETNKQYTFCSCLELHPVDYEEWDDGLHRVVAMGFINHSVIPSLVESAQNVKKEIANNPFGHLAKRYKELDKEIIELEEFLAKHHLEVESFVEDPTNNMIENYYYNGNNGNRDYVTGDCLEFERNHILEVMMEENPAISSDEALQQIANDETVRYNLFKKLGFSNELFASDDFQDKEWINNLVNGEGIWYRFREFANDYR